MELWHKNSDRCVLSAMHQAEVSEIGASWRYMNSSYCDDTKVGFHKSEMLIKKEKLLQCGLPQIADVWRQRQ